jgi:hypothetical protein
LKGLAAYVGICAVTLTVIHLVLPRMRVNQMTQSVARALLVRAEWERDFDFLVQNPQMQGKRLGAILEHAELAHLQRPQFYSALEESTYQDFVLSPVVDALPVSEVDWRRSFWDHFYPRVRKEHDAMSAAQIVVRFLRERVGIDPANASRVGPETIWEQQMTDEKGFERTYVAALRSVGVAARLNEGHRTEMWWGNAWVEAPRPIIASWSTSIEKNN